MKLRLRANTIRLRLLKAEVDQLALGLAITESLPTPRPFSYAVVPASVSDLEAHFEADTLTIRVPSDWASQWALNEEVGRHSTSGPLDILIEKDWACTTPRQGEENVGTYPNPTALR
jgi:hypothetical protein